jgi:hypothetical protein
MSTTNYPDGTSLVSDALTLTEMNAIIQELTQGMLGQVVSPTASLVRISWPTEGAPFQEATDDVTYIRCILKDDPYDKIRDKFNWGPEGWGSGQFGKQPPWGGTLSGVPALTEQWNYTRVWEIHWVIYGPNSLDNSRAIRSALYQDYFTDLLALEQLFPMSEFPEAIRAPELIDAQWWERVDLKCEIYEFVTETIARQTVVSVENILAVAAGQVADFTVTADD